MSLSDQFEPMKPKLFAKKTGYTLEALPKQRDKNMWSNYGVSFKPWLHNKTDL